MTMKNHNTLLSAYTCTMKMENIEYVACKCTILAVRRRRRIEVKGENNILKCAGGVGEAKLPT